MKWAWACTVHKVQVLGLNSGVTSFDLERQKSFNTGQRYVALSRKTNFEGMYLIGTYQKFSSVQQQVNRATSTST